MIRISRMKKELKMLKTDPPAGISCWPVEDRADLLEAKLVGASGTPYEGGVFKLEISIPDRSAKSPRVRAMLSLQHTGTPSNHLSFASSPKSTTQISMTRVGFALMC